MPNEEALRLAALHNNSDETFHKLCYMNKVSAMTFCFCFVLFLFVCFFFSSIQKHCSRSPVTQNFGLWGRTEHTQSGIQCHLGYQILKKSMLRLTYIFSKFANTVSVTLQLCNMNTVTILD